jgi:hypothetical protein
MGLPHTDMLYDCKSSSIYAIGVVPAGFPHQDPHCCWVAIQLSSSNSVYYSPNGLSHYAKAYGAFVPAWSSGSRQDSAAQWNMRVTYVAALYVTNTNVPSATGDFGLAVHNDASGP